MKVCADGPWIWRGGNCHIFTLIFIYLCCEDLGVDAQARASNDRMDFVIGIALPEDLEGSKCKEASKGYKLFENELEIKRENGEMVMQWERGRQTNFTVEIKYFEGAADLAANKDEIDFFLGCEDNDSQYPAVARIAHWSEKIYLRCCSQRSVDATSQLSNTFDLQPDGAKYTDLFTRSLLLQGIHRYAIYHDKESAFHVSACEAASVLIDDFEGVKDNKVMVGSYSKRSMALEMKREYFALLAESARMNNIEAVIACVDEEDAEILVRAFDDIRYPLKSLFLMDGPANHVWAERMGELIQDTVTASLWRERQFVNDNFYGSKKKFVRKMKNEFGEDAQVSSAAAAAAASGHLLISALRYAFQTCDPGTSLNKTALLEGSGGICRTTGTSAIRDWLLQDSFRSMIGTVDFSRKNVNTEYPGTHQLDSNLQANVILPLAEKPMVMPARNRFLQACSQGDFNVGDGFEGCRPCPPGSFSNSSDVKECTLCPLGFFNSEEGKTSCTDCPTHTTTIVKGAKNLSDCTCKVGYYGNSTGMECKPCVDGTTCEGNTMQPIALKGYWMEESTLQVFQCDPPSNCQGAGECKEGWEGIMCTSCKSGHFKLGDSCQACPGRATFGLLIVLLYLGWYLLNMIVSSSMASLDMLLGFAQLANVIGDVKLQWPSALEKTFGVTNILDFDLDIMWPSCLFADWSFAHNFYVQLLFPVVMGLMALTGFLLSKFCLWFIRVDDEKGSRKEKLRRLEFALTVPLNKEQLDEKWDNTIAACFAAIEVSYVTLSKYLFDVFKCTHIAGYEVLDASPDIVCGSRAHQLLICGAVVGILFYSIGYPVFVAAKLLNMHSHRSYPHPRNVRRYGFLYKRFEPGYIWMALFVLVRRLAFVLVLIFMESPAFQAASLALITTGSLIVHVYTAPYVDTYLDVLFSFLLVALTFETFGGLMFFNDNLTSSELYILEVFILSVMCCVGVVFFVIFALEVRSMYLVHKIHRLHLQAVLFKNPSSGSEGEEPMDHERQAKTDASEVSKELLETFEPGFLHSALSGWEEGLQDWDKLTDKLKIFMSDGSETSYLSTDNIARFWRKLVAKFPELIDFLAITDTETRDHFVVFVNALYSNYFLKKKVDKLQIFSVLNWRDRAPLAHWLSSCSEDDRQFFSDFMARLFQRAHGQKPQEALTSKDTIHEVSECSDNCEQSVSSSFRSIHTQLRKLDFIPRNFLVLNEDGPQPLGFMKSHRKRSIKREIQSGNGPLRHSAHARGLSRSGDHLTLSSETFQMHGSKATDFSSSCASLMESSQNLNVLRNNVPLEASAFRLSHTVSESLVEKENTEENADRGEFDPPISFLDNPRRTI